MPPADDDYDAPTPKTPEKSNAAGLALSIIGLVLGVCALLFSFIPCLGALAFWPGVVAVILSIIALVVSTKSKALPIVAVVVSVLGTGIAYWQGERVKGAANEVEKGLKGFQQDLNKNMNDMQKRLEEENKKREEDMKKKGGN